ncbi:MAG TPA: thrombospondin type 3 repeat-containing protein [Verrucomicrobiae bacterium]|nr:thrombospondin type 3 repeat-containing protein [Verrucomicrobiae bacterium]
MKISVLHLLVFGFATCAFSAQTEHYTVRIGLPGDPNALIGGGDLRLTGTNLFYSLDVSGAPATFVSTGTVNAVSASGPNGAILFPLDGPFCSADRGCGFFGEGPITAEQAALIRSGGTQVVVDDFYLGRIVPNALCESPGTNVIGLEATLRGRVSVENRARVVWGMAAFTLSGHLLRYRIDLPAILGDYFGVIDEQMTFDPFGGGHLLVLGTLDCGPTATNLPPATGGFDSLPRCLQEGSICLPDDVLPSLLAGNWVASFYQPFSGQYAQGDILPVDTDGDNVPDYLDACPETPSGALVNTNGCSIEQLAPCAGPWKSHGEYVNRVKEVTSDFARAGLITEAQRRALLNQAAQSGCGGR